ncbi:hypothetical protein MKW98_009161 [Papaver atlanticum]|uniref:Uncharacterized protein n=1 Tax=Papaver atlanticum TaxID=357466 RepID=A0AAD4XT92_9MAGN|nr:hypothetical protein MKW98_009161 [Papaver atlanticum]
MLTCEGDHELHYGGGNTMDNLDTFESILSASSYEAGVAAGGANVNVDKCLQVTKEESCKQETEEDASSTSSVGYYYTEEGSGNEDEDDEVGMTYDVAEMYSLKRISDPELNKSAITLPELKDWVDSWKVNDNDPSLFVWVHVYAYYNKDEGYGGYGVILRYSAADGKSFFTQVLMGVKAGVRLAKKHKLSGLHVGCNSVEVPNLIYQICGCRNIEFTSAAGPYDPSICNWCEGYLTWTDGCDLSLLPHLREIKDEIHNGPYVRDVSRSPRVLNAAAYYLAKMEKRKQKIARGDNEEPGEIEPDDFRQELKNILWKDAFGI